MSSYFTRFKILCDELVNYQAFPTCTCTCTCGSKKSQLDAQKKDQVFRFLMGLNDSYANVRSQILITEPLPGINKVYSLILQEEKRRQIGQANMVLEPTALYANNSSNAKGYQGQTYHGGNQKGKVVIMKDMVEKEGIQIKKGLSVLIVELLAILQINVTCCMVIPQVISLKGNLLPIRFLV